jgi:Spy/CpxP family protein refolding chaperone
MKRVRSWLVLAMVLVLAVAFTSAAVAQEREGSRRGSGRGFSRGSLLGLLRMEQVQGEMKLSEEQTAKVQKLVEKLGTELREQYTALREIEDRQEMIKKATALGDEFDGKVREQLRDLVEREQIMRLYQIRMQVRSAVDSLSNRYVAGRLDLTDEQKKKLAEIAKDSQAKQSELFGTFRDATAEQRTEAYQKFRKIRSDADEKALAALTAEQKVAFEEMKGEKIELEMRRGRRPTT